MAQKYVKGAIIARTKTYAPNRIGEVPGGNLLSESKKPVINV
jgi:hypothetical protein